MKKIILFLLLFYGEKSNCQTTDSLQDFIYKESTDSARIRAIYEVLRHSGEVKPEEAIQLHAKVLDLAKKNKDKIGESVATAELGYQFILAGNTVLGTQLTLDALKLAEKTNNSQAIGIAFQNLGICYQYAEPAKYKFYQQKAMEYSAAAGDDLFICWELMNLSNIYLSQVPKQLDSALSFAEKAYRLAVEKKVEEPMPFILQTLSKIHYFLQNKGLSIEYIRMMERTKMAEKNNNTKCLIYRAYTSFYMGEKQMDSALYYAYKNLEYAQKAVITTMIYPTFALKMLYAKTNADSALKYTNMYYAAKDSAQNIQKLQQVQAISFEETRRQEKIEQEKLKAKKERMQNLQYAAIAIALITFLILFFTLSRSIVVKTKFIEFFGVLGLLAVFEFINLFIHPYLSHATNDSPVLMLLILIGIGAMLVPQHHRLEKWITKIMVEKNKKIRLEAAKKTIQQLEG